MKDKDRENLAELIERLFNSEQAGDVLKDINQGEQILRDNPAPEPDRQLTSDIKTQITLLIPGIQAQKKLLRLYKRAAVAAAIIIITGLSLMFFNSPTPETKGPTQFAGLIPSRIWDSDNIAADDEKLAVFTAQIDQIENEVLTLELGDDTYRNDWTVEEMEMELIVVRNAFWKE